MKRRWVTLDQLAFDSMTSERWFSVIHLADAHKVDRCSFFESVRRLVQDGLVELRFRDKYIYARLARA